MPPPFCLPLIRAAYHSDRMKARAGNAGAGFCQRDQIRLCEPPSPPTIA